MEQYLQLIKRRWGKKAYYYIPSLFWLNASDAALMALVISGTILSALLVFGIMPWLLLPLIFVLHLSLVSAGQDFLSFGWESFLLEITFNTLFLIWSWPPNPISWISLNLLLFRFHFQAGVSKIFSRDANWRNLTAIWYHYQSQPIPNTQAWYVHKFPMWFHKLSTAMMFFIELIVPFGIFATDDIRFVTCILLVGLQLFIWATGNFSYLNHLSAVFSLILISDPILQYMFTVTPPQQVESPLLLQIFTWTCGSALLFLQIISLWNYLFTYNHTFDKILRWLAPFHIANRYGIFAIMTTERIEIVIEGSYDNVEWKEYLFRQKPSELTRRPRRISPYQPRLDWQAWFLPFTGYHQEWWFQSFLTRLLQGSPEVLKLLRHNPFPDKPPKIVRALAYDYEFTDAETKKKSGAWWKRRFVGFYAPPVMLAGQDDADEEGDATS